MLGSERKTLDRVALRPATRRGSFSVILRCKDLKRGRGLMHRVTYKKRLAPRQAVPRLDE